MTSQTSSTSPPSLVIFDCDGVLVDSERLAHQTLIDTVAPLGLHFTMQEAMGLFRGRKMSECVEEVENRLGYRLTESFIEEFRQRQHSAFRAGLKPVEGIIEALEAIDQPICVASSGPREKIVLSLTLTGLLERFDGAIYSAYEVGSWKPDPGLFLHAAKSWEISPGRCIVIEDSTPGVRAGVAAGMTVLGYAADADPDELAAAGARIFHSMHELPALVRSIRQQFE
jgi:HAD superfamily hydrolase (TIGR01509 family)